MGRKNKIEGQLSLFDVVLMEPEVSEAEERVATEGKEYAPGSFAECASCWCATCEHSSVGGSVPRSFGESARPCPSCELCIREGKADVCVIGSAEEGCRYRAEKEGLSERAEEVWD